MDRQFFDILEDGTCIDRLRFYSYDELKKWCEDNMESGISLYYGDVASMGDWYEEMTRLSQSSCVTPYIA